ncbi:putative sugar efflux transporter [Paractinoplanes deccanensis]|uniref:Sugar efflux transporter n=1 Tax=Paractinoplanes deccanensis TaxID=113561 RepID=A0ABQ3Y3X9_9ACTN|nr:MFS transporter [Actinoplanes deccanensis]GID74693.1 putative sugar efflux transporter [Actinoplanes deccanensis]
MTFLPLLGGVLLLGVADSMIGPYLVLYGTDEANLSPFRAGVLLSLISLSGLVVSTWLGRRYDRAASRWPAFLAVTAPAAGYLALTFTTAYPLLLLIGAGLLGAGMAAFPQLFTLARTHLGDHPRATPALRSVWSLAWAIGPIAGAALLAAGGYHRLLQVTALAFLLVSVPLALVGRTPRARAQERTGTTPLPRSMLPVAAAFTLFHTAMLAGSVVLPLYVTRTLHRPDDDVGLLFSVCALVEIPAALATMLLPARARKRPVVLLGMALFAAYFVLVAFSAGMPALIATQVARGMALAVVGALGITYVQDLAPHAAGRATALYANTLTVGSLVSGVLAGATAQALGYRAALLLCAALTAGGLLLLAARRAESDRGRIEAIQSRVGAG